MNFRFSIEITNLGKLHGCHYVPRLVLVQLDVFQEKPYQIHYHYSRNLQ